MAARLFYLPFRPAINANGLVVSGATLTFYAAGTTTFQPIYSTAALTTTLSNPLSANAAGVWPEIYLNDALKYRVIVKDATGSTLYDVDNYIAGIAGEKGDPGGNVMAVGLLSQVSAMTIPTGVDVITVSGLTAVGDVGAGMMLVYDAAVDAAYVTANPTTSVRDLTGRGFRSVRSRNIIVDADYSTLQAAVTAAAGKTLFLALAWTIAATITVPDNTTILNGGGSVTASVGEINVFEPGNRCMLDGLKIIGRNALPAGASSDFTKNNGVYALGKSGLVIQNCKISRCGFTGIQLRGCLEPTIANNHLFDNIWDTSVSAANNSADICFYSGAAIGKRAIITGNRCNSNNSQGIYYNALGQDADGIITHNTVCSTDSTTGLDISAANLMRRHGIVAGYVGGLSARTLVAINNVRNTRWTGIYRPASSALEGPVQIIANTLSSCGINSETLPGPGASGGLTGSVFLQATDSDVVALNTIVDSANTLSGTGAITVVSSFAGARPLILDNTIKNSGAAAICLTNSLEAAIIRGNKIFASAGADVQVTLSSGSATIGDIGISQNEFIRNNVAAPCVLLQHGDSTRTIRVHNNTFRNTGATSDTNNVGIRSDSPYYVSITNNNFRGFNRATEQTNYIPTVTRLMNLPYYSNNEVYNCNVAHAMACSASTSTVAVYGTMMQGTATFTDTGTIGGAIVARAAVRFGDTIEITSTAAPSTGCGAVGDRSRNSAPAVGSPKAWLCTVAGGPGTWVSEGNL